MRKGEFMDAMLRTAGVIRIEPIPPDLAQSVAATEVSVDTITGGMRLENIGLFQCLHCPDVFVLFCDGVFKRPNEITMRMIDLDGVVIGHDVPPDMIHEYEGRTDICWMSDGFVLFPERIGNRDAKMVIGCSEYLSEDIDEGTRMRLFYPSIRSAELMNTRFGVFREGVSTAILGVDGLEACDDRSVPVSDVVEVPRGRCGHCESTPEDPFYRCDLVGEALHVPEFPLADEDLHALLMVQVDVDRCLHHVRVGMLDVRELVTDGCHGMVVHHHYGTHHPFLIVLPFVLRKGIADEVTDSLRPADVSFLGDRFIELPQEFGFEGNTYACYSIHVFAD